METLDWDPTELWEDIISFDDPATQDLSDMVFPISLDAPDISGISHFYAKLDGIYMVDLDEIIIDETLQDPCQTLHETKAEEQPSTLKCTAVTTLPATATSSVTASTKKPATASRKRKHTGGRVNDNRATKQRGYERVYRDRLKDRRDQMAMEWLQLEGELRRLLAGQAAQCVTTVDVHVNTRKDDEDKRNGLLELLHEAHGHYQDIAMYKCVETWLQVLDSWGTETSASRSIREQINSLPIPHKCRAFSFKW